MLCLSKTYSKENVCLYGLLNNACRSLWNLTSSNKAGEVFSYPIGGMLLLHFLEFTRGPSDTSPTYAGSWKQSELCSLCKQLNGLSANSLAISCSFCCLVLWRTGERWHETEILAACICTP